MVEFLQYLTLSDALLHLPKNSFQICEDTQNTVTLIKALLAGERTSPEWEKLQKYIISQDELPIAAAVSGASVDENILLEKLLEMCNEQALDQLVLEYGEDSPLGRRIANHRKQSSLSDKQLKSEIALFDQEKERSFYKLLCDEIKKQGYQSEAEFYNSIQFSRKIFSKIRTQEDYTLSKDNVLWLTAGLGLDYWSTLRLLRAQGYSFRPRSRRDTIITYVLKNGHYTLDELNEMLFFFGEKTLGDPF